MFRRKHNWTRFYPKQEKTWPPYGQLVLVYDEGEADDETDKSGYRLDHDGATWKDESVLWWHALPNPPLGARS
jgi:hypothetical protein